MQETALVEGFWGERYIDGIFTLNRLAGPYFAYFFLELRFFKDWRAFLID
jgi:hypothetical protein